MTRNKSVGAIAEEIFSAILVAEGHEVLDCSKVDPYWRWDITAYQPDKLDLKMYEVRFSGGNNNRFYCLSKDKFFKLEPFFDAHHSTFFLAVVSLIREGIFIFDARAVLEAATSIGGVDYIKIPYNSSIKMYPLSGKRLELLQDSCVPADKNSDIFPF